MGRAGTLRAQDLGVICMDLVISAVVIGVVGTAAMDLGNLLFARLGVIARVDLQVLGRMARGEETRRGPLPLGSGDRLTVRADAGRETSLREE